MESQIFELPIVIVLHGFRGSVRHQSVHEAGKRLMDRMWQEIQRSGLRTKGINHWVYLPDSEMFTGIELADGIVCEPGTMDVLEVRLQRYLRYVHRGPYSQLPEIWPALMKGLSELHETAECPHLEIYGHWNPDPEKCETTILIGLSPRR